MTRAKGAENKTQFNPVTNESALEELFTLSNSQPVILFKHSTTCPISAAAYQQMTDYGGEVSLVVVQKSRDISRRVESLTGVRHESPQAIILRDGKAVWSASHWSITADAVKSEFDKLQ
ncbi:MAG TPA: bacillithiol system redox-active protein YtxJ [Pyrinomonadaceae bacterium]